MTRDQKRALRQRGIEYAKVTQWYIAVVGSRLDSGDTSPEIIGRLMHDAAYFLDLAAHPERGCE